MGTVIRYLTSLQRANKQRWWGALSALLPLVLLLASGLPVQAAVPMQTITSAGPLLNIYLGNELSAQINHSLDPTAYEVFPPRTTPGDYGTFAVIDGALYAPSFAQHGSSATGSIGSYTAFTPVSQTTPSGSGTIASPYQVVTQVQAGSTGIAITQTDSYVTGNDYFRTDITFTNSGPADKAVLVYRALDCYLGASDTGYGTAVGGTVSCSINPNNNPLGRSITLIPLTGPSKYRQDNYSQIWARIGTHQPFDNRCVRCTTRADNGIGLSWELTVPAGDSVTISHLSLFSPSGILPLTMAKTVTPSDAKVGDEVTYTISVSNPNPSAADLNTAVDTLPAGFSYVPDTTSGITTSNPAVAGQELTWNGPWSVPGNNSTISLSFKVKVMAAPGATYFNRAQGTGGSGISVQETGDTAPVTVSAAGPLTIGKAVSPATATPGQQVSYTITVNNPNPVAVALATLTDTLPAGFTYVAGTSTGASSSDPAIAGQNLSWSGPWSVPANGSLSLKFGATVSATPGTFYNRAEGTTSNSAYPVTGSGDAAPVTVSAAQVQPVPALSDHLLMLMAALVALAGLRSRRSSR